VPSEGSALFNSTLTPAHDLELHSVRRRRLRHASARDRHSAQPVRRARFTGATSSTVGVFGTVYESKAVEHLVSQTVTGSVSASQVLVWIATQAWREGTLKRAVRSGQSLRWLLPYHPTVEAWLARGDQDRDRALAFNSSRKPQTYSISIASQPPAVVGQRGLAIQRLAFHALKNDPSPLNRSGDGRR
jgi:hypothetical protein